MFLLIFSVPFSGFYSDFALVNANCTKLKIAKLFLPHFDSEQEKELLVWKKKERKKDECITVLIFVLFLIKPSPILF